MKHSCYLHDTVECRLHQIRFQLRACFFDFCYVLKIDKICNWLNEKLKKLFKRKYAGSYELSDNVLKAEIITFKALSMNSCLDEWIINLEKTGYKIPNLTEHECIQLAEISTFSFSDIKSAFFSVYRTVNSGLLVPPNIFPFV